jgi:hypothetical protein
MNKVELHRLREIAQEAAANNAECGCDFGPTVVLELLAEIELLKSAQGEEFIVRAGDFDPKKHERQVIEDDEYLVWGSLLPAELWPERLIVVRNKKAPEPRYYVDTGNYGTTVRDRTRTSGDGWYANCFDTEAAQAYADWLNSQEPQ